MMKSPLYADANRFRLGTDSVLNTGDPLVQSNIYRELAGNTKVDRLLFYHWWLVGRELLKNYSDNVSLSFLFVTGDPNLRHGTGEHGLFLLIFLPFFVAGWYSLFKTQKTLCLWLLAWWLAALLPASVPQTTPHALRSLNALLPLSLAIGVGGSAWWAWLKQPLGRGVLVGLVTVSVLAFVYHYFTFYATDSALEWQVGYREVAQAIYQVRQDHQPVVVVPFDDRFYLWLMAFGPYSGHEFQTWTSRNYQFDTFDGVTFLPEPNIHEPTLLAGRASAVLPLITKYKYQIKSEQTIQVVPNQPAFIVAEVEAK